MKVLVVDDSEVNLFLLENWLRRGNYEVTIARNGVEALERLEQELVDLIVSDVLMPKMDGFELCHQVKTHPRTQHIPFVFFSADYMSDEDEQFALRLGASKYILKSDNPVAFVWDLDEVLRDSQQGTLGQQIAAPDKVTYQEEHVKRLVQKLEEKVSALEKSNEELGESNRKLQKLDKLKDEVIEALRHSEERYRALYDDNPSMYFTTSTEGTVLSVNQFGAEQLGYTVKDLMGKSVLQIAARDDRSAIQEELDACLGDAERLAHRECRLTRKDGSALWVKLLARAVRGVDGAKVVLIAAEDITEHKRTEEALRERDEMLRQVQKMEAVGMLAGGIAHDFNNLLMVIMGHSDHLLQGLEQGTAYHQSAAQIKKAGGQATVLTQQLLAFSRRQVLQPSALDLNVVVADIIQMLRRLIGEDVELVTSLGPALGTVRADRVQLEQVIINLAVNARDALPEGGRIIIETLNQECDEALARRHPDLHVGPYVVLLIRDTGCGMDEETQHRMFEPFYTTKERGKGTGLGLSTVYGIVEQSGGHILVDSTPGKGTTMQILLPRVAEEATPADPAVAAPALPTGTETILLVEDEYEVRKLVSEILRTFGYAVIDVGRGDEALQLAQRHEGKLDLLLTDVVMPGMNGPALAERLQAERPGIKIMYMSGYTDEPLAIRAATELGTGFLQKPFSPDILAIRVREVLDRATVSTGLPA